MEMSFAPACHRRAYAKPFDHSQFMDTKSAPAVHREHGRYRLALVNGQLIEEIHVGWLAAARSKGELRFEEECAACRTSVPPLCPKARNALKKRIGALPDPRKPILNAPPAFFLRL
jgi:hypothetical protein